MSAADWLQLFFLIISLLILSLSLGKYMAKVFGGEFSFFGAIERGSYRICGIQPGQEMSWQQYAKALLTFNVIGATALFLLQLVQNFLPLNPEKLPNVGWALAFNTAISFVTNTNWQSYAGETTMSYLTQMGGLAVQNFLSAATGFSVLLALIRGLTRKLQDTIGNFWVDLTRCVLYILLPLAIVGAIFLVTQGVIQTFSPYVEVTTLEGAKQKIPLGPVASQIAIKQLGTNGGGFFNVNSAHPFENPTALSNFFEVLAILLIPAASVFMYGHMINNRRHGWLLFLVMAALTVGGFWLSMYSESLPNPVLDVSPVLEGKETRFGTMNSILWSVWTTGTANGSVNTMHSSLSPLSGGVALFNIMLGECLFGGVGVGLCSMIIFVLLTVFLSGLMVGRTPEYLGKKIEKREVQWLIVAILVPGAVILLGAALACALPGALSCLGNTGPHGLSEILYAFTSCAGNNGSAFAGLNANTDFYNITLGCVMLITRLAILVPSLGIAGLLVKKKIVPKSIGTFSTETALFAILLISVIFIVGALTFFPALSLGPIVEQFLMLRGYAT